MLMARIFFPLFFQAWCRLHPFPLSDGGTVFPSGPLSGSDVALDLVVMTPVFLHILGIDSLSVSRKRRFLLFVVILNEEFQERRILSSYSAKLLECKGDPVTVLLCPPPPYNTTGSGRLFAA